MLPDIQDENSHDHDYRWGGSALAHVSVEILA